MKSLFLIFLLTSAFVVANEPMDLCLHLESAKKINDCLNKVTSIQQNINTVRAELKSIEHHRLSATRSEAIRVSDLLADTMSKILYVGSAYSSNESDEFINESLTNYGQLKEQAANLGL